MLKFFLVFSANSSFGLIKQEHLRWHLPHAIITCDHLTMECYLIIFLVLPDQLTKYPGTRNLLYVKIIEAMSLPLILFLAISTEIMLPFLVCAAGPELEHK